MNSDVESTLRRAFTEGDVPVPDLDERHVLRLGQRARTIRTRRRVVGGVAAAAIVAFGVAQLVVPASGSPLTPLVWAIGPAGSGSEPGAWVTGAGKRFVVSIRDAYLGDRSVVMISALDPDGSTRDLMAYSPVRAEDMPAVGFAVSTAPRVSFGLFPAGAHAIEAHADDGTPVTVSTMLISSPHGGPDYVAVAATTQHPNVMVTGITWLDAEARPLTWGNG